MMHKHHDANMRTTLDLPDDLHRKDERPAKHAVLPDGNVLAALARHHGGRLATFDQGLAALHSDIAELIAAA